VHVTVIQGKHTMSVGISHVKFVKSFSPFYNLILAVSQIGKTKDRLLPQNFK